MLAIAAEQPSDYSAFIRENRTSATSMQLSEEENFMLSPVIVDCAVFNAEKSVDPGTYV
jgi:hypothetical protein